MKQYSDISSVTNFDTLIKFNKNTLQYSILLFLILLMPAFNSIGTSGLKIIEVVAIVLLPFGILSFFLRTHSEILKCDLYLILYIVISTISYLYNFYKNGNSDMTTMFIGELKVLSLYFLAYFLGIKNNPSSNFKFAVILLFLGFLQANISTINHILMKIYISKTWDNSLYNQMLVSFTKPPQFLYGLLILLFSSIRKEEFFNVSVKNICFLLIIIYIGILTSLMTFIVAIITVLPFFLKNKKYLLVYAVGLIIGICYFLLYDGHNQEITNLREFITGFFSGTVSMPDFLSYSHALQARFEVTLIEGWNNFLSSPIIGIGAGGSMDSFYFNLLASKGIIGFFFFFAFIISYYKIADVQMRFIVICLLVTSLFHAPFASDRNGMLIWALMGMGTNAIRFSKNKINKC